MRSSDNTVHVLKSNGNVRVCIDATPVNKVTLSFDWPMPRLQDLRHHLRGQKGFCCLELEQAFFRIAVLVGWRRFTARCSAGVVGSIGDSL
jgi:hypothetical protein